MVLENTNWEIKNRIHFISADNDRSFKDLTLVNKINLNNNHKVTACGFDVKIE